MTGMALGDIVLWNTVYDLDPLNGTNEFGLTANKGGPQLSGARPAWQGEEIDASNLQQKAAAAWVRIRGAYVEPP